MVGHPAGISGGSPEPLGATYDGYGVNFAIFSANADKVELCLFDRDGQTETARFELQSRTGDIWHGYHPGARCGQLYGYRVHGPYDPKRGHRFNANKLVIDPYARALDRPFVWNDLHCGYVPSSLDADLSFDRRDNASVAPKCRVVDANVDWQDDRRPLVPAKDLVIYELHVRGYTMLHSALEAGTRGTFAGLGDPVLVKHLVDLGITAVELMPVNPIGTSRRLSQMGLRDYWGYNSLNFFALEPRYLAGGSLDEFRQMVRALHHAGIEVILDMVFNHTGELDESGPTVSFRGIDNLSYYRLSDDGRHYIDYTGCKNTFDFDNPIVVKMALDAMRYWVRDMHVDGFRLDLAVSLGRGGPAFSNAAPLFAAIRNDPMLSNIKLIAEPWDLGPGGYQLGAFAQPWREWNDKSRDSVRRFWRGDAGEARELAYRLSGSSDVFAPSGRGPTAGINFVTAHDGFSLADLVTYEAKRNAENGENNADGTNENYSTNCGAEGPTDEPDIVTMRNRQRRNLIATLLLSQGLPMLRAGDEIGQTQHGNNNAYCQDNEISWINWDKLESESGFISFVRKMIAVRKSNAVFRRTVFFRGVPPDEGGIKDIAWLRPDGVEMSEDDWHAPDTRALGVQMAADGLAAAEGTRAFALILNASPHALEFRLSSAGLLWRVVVDTAIEGALSDEAVHAGGTYHLESRSLALLAGRRA